MKSSVITFPGSNCARDLDVALKKFGFNDEELQWILGNNWFNFYKDYIN